MKGYIRPHEGGEISPQEVIPSASLDMTLTFSHLGKRELAAGLRPAQPFM